MKSAYNRPLRVFLCHSSTDKPAVRELYQKLRAEARIQPWLDEEELLGGQDFDLEIDKATHDADAIIICLSEISVKEEGYVNKEIRRALDIAQEKPEGLIYIIPLRLDNCIPSFAQLKKLHWVDYFSPNAHEKLLKSLQVRADSLGLNIDKSKPVNQIDDAESELYKNVNYFKTTYQLYPNNDVPSPSPNSIVENILERCLQSPFGGRDVEFSRIDKYLSEKDHGYIFVTGDSGIGKTSLMGQVVERLSKQGVNSIYHFISRRDGTANEEDFLRWLCRQLVNNFKFAGALPDNLSDIRALYSDLLTRISTDKTHLVLVIDGLDEADGWSPNRSIFPLNLSKGIYVLFSARRIANTDWLAQLELTRKNCEVIDLGVLSKAEIIQAFHVAGGKAANWIDDKKFCGDVVDISNGDPIYIQCLITDIDDGIITPDNIGNKPKSLETYLDQWWESIQSEFEDNRVKDLLGYLAVARDPLDWIDLANIYASDSLNEFTLDTALSKAKRLIVGDRQAGYRFTHARYQDYITRKFQKTLTQYEEKLIEYCKTTWKNHNKYSLRNLVSHLVDRKKHDDIHSLLTQPEYMRAKRFVFGSYYNFLVDINRAIEICGQAGFTELPNLIFYSLLQSILRTQTANIAPDVLRVLAELGELERAINYAKSIADPLQKATAFQFLGGGGWDAEYYFGRKQKKLNYDSFLLERAYDEAMLIQNFDDRVKFLSSLAPVLARAGNSEKAFLCVQEIGSKYPDDEQLLWFKRDAQKKIPVELAYAGMKHEALMALENIEDKYSRKDVLKQVVRVLGESGMIEAALDIAVNNLDQPGSDDKYDIDIIRWLSLGVGFREDWLRGIVANARDLHQDERVVLFDNLATKMRSLIKEEKAKEQNQIINQENRYVTAEKARLFAWLGQYNTAFDLLKSLEKNNFWMYSTDWVDLFATGLLIDDRKNDVLYLIENQWTSNRYEDFEKSISTWEETQSKFEVLTDKREAKNILMNLLKQRPHSSKVSPAIQSLAVHLVEAGHFELMFECFKPNLYENYYEHAFETELSEIATHLARRKMLEQAEILMKKMNAEYMVEPSFINFAGTLIGADRQRDIVPVAKRFIQKPYERCKVISSVVDFYAKENKAKSFILLEEALIDAESPSEIYSYQNKVLIPIARGLSRNMAFEKALIAGKLFMTKEPFEFSEVAGEYISKASDSINSEVRLLETIEFINQVPENEQRQALLCCLSISLGIRDLNEFSVKVIEQVDEDYFLKAYALGVLAGKTHPTNENLAKEFLSRASKIAKKFDNSDEKLHENNLGDNEDRVNSDNLPKKIDESPSNSENDTLPDSSILRFWSQTKLAAYIAIEESVRSVFSYRYQSQYQPDSDDLKSDIMSALLATGWIEQALSYYDEVEEDWFKDNRLFSAMLYSAILGDNINVYKMLDHLKKNLKPYGGESDIVLILKGVEYFQLVKSENYSESEKIAKELIALLDRRDLFRRDQDESGKVIDDFNKDNFAVEFFETLCLAYMQNDNVQGVVEILKQVPSNILEVKLIAQIKCVLFFLEKSELSKAEDIVPTINDQGWVDLARKLVQCKNSAGDRSNTDQLVLSALRDLQKIRKTAENPFVRYSIILLSFEVLLKLGKFLNTLSVIDEFEYLKHHNDAFDYLERHNDIKQRLLLGLIQAGKIDEAFVIFDRLDFSVHGSKLWMVKEIATELFDLPSDQTLRGVQHLLEIARSNDYEFTYETISCIVPIIQKHYGVETVWSVFNATTRINGYWS